MGREFSRERGLAFERHIAYLFERAGYHVELSVRPRGPFDFVATQGNEVIAVQVKTTHSPSIPPIDTRRCAEYPLPDGAQRLYWHHCGKYDRHTVQSIDTHAHLKLASNPLGFMFPPPLDKNLTNAGRRRYKSQTQKSPGNFSATGA